MYSRYCLKGDLSLKDSIKLFLFNRNLEKTPDYFKPDGTICFCGPQGSGKTLSAVRYINNLHRLYPKAVIISNITLNGLDYLPFIGLEESLKKYPSNGVFGTIMLIDEIPILFNSLESKNYSPSKFAVIAQQRKRRIHIVGTAQLYTRINRSFREQIRGVVDCDSIMGGTIQRNRIVDFSRCAYDMNGNLTETAYSGQFLWSRRVSDYEAYNTEELVERTDY